MNKEIRKVIKALEAAGFEVTRTPKGRFTVTRDGEFVTQLSATATEYHSLRNALAPARRRFGFRWPP